MQLLFPVGCNAHWHKPQANELSTIEQSWLLDQGSLTARLKTISSCVEVKLIGQKLLLLDNHETNLLPGYKHVIVREVVLYCNGKPWIFARSLIPESLQLTASSILTSLGNQPLGERLFQDSNLQRDSFEVAIFEQQSNVSNLAASLSNKSPQSLWGRRSRFIVEQQPLVVQEIFLPFSNLYQE